MNRPFKRWTSTILSGLATLTCGCANAQDRTSGYSYGMVELPTNGASIDNPNKPYRELWEATSSRAAEEALVDSTVSTAFRGGTFFGRDSDSYLAYAITPERGVFYYLPPGPYPLKGGPILALPDKVQACRLEIEWSKIDQPDAISNMRSLDFVSRDCEPFGTDDHVAEEVSPDQELTIQASSLKSGQSVSLVSSNLRSGLFDTTKALSAVMVADGRKLIHTVPLAGINEPNLVAGVSDIGTVYLAIESGRFNQRCVLAADDWANVNDSRLRISARGECRRVAQR